MTSPPYGDNLTTVTYGQHSYLPLHWIDLADIDHSVDSTVLRTTHELDARSLGGREQKTAWSSERLFESSCLLKSTADKLGPIKGDGFLRLMRFYGDFSETLEQVVSLLSPAGYMIWTVGNRSIAGLQVPTDAILTELFDALGCSVVTTLGRQIHHKRMPARNASSATMREERILLVRRVTQ
jgi:hypothetical protein